jgi:hypothetical protein
MQPKAVAIRKRTQIASANRLMFLWVAGVSVVFGVSLVATIFLTQILLFNERVLYEKGVTVSTLNSNYENVTKTKGLQDNIRLLDTNQALIDSKAKPEDQAIQVILDALPSDANSLALGASLQNKLIFGINGLSLESLQVDPVAGVETQSDEESVVDASASSTQGEITFRFSVKGDETALMQLLTNLEKSIRTIDIVSLKIESQNGSRVLSAQARAFYEPVRDVKITEKTVK